MAKHKAPPPKAKGKAPAPKAPPQQALPIPPNMKGPMMMPPPGRKNMV